MCLERRDRRKERAGPDGETSESLAQESRVRFDFQSEEKQRLESSGQEKHGRSESKLELGNPFMNTEEDTQGSMSATVLSLSGMNA